MAETGKSMTDLCTKAGVDHRIIKRSATDPIRPKMAFKIAQFLNVPTSEILLREDVPKQDAMAVGSTADAEDSRFVPI
jgi:hypothetical protein